MHKFCWQIRLLRSLCCFQPAISLRDVILDTAMQSIVHNRESTRYADDTTGHWMTELLYALFAYLMLIDAAIHYQYRWLFAA